MITSKYVISDPKSFLCHANKDTERCQARPSRRDRSRRRGCNGAARTTGRRNVSRLDSLLNASPHPCTDYNTMTLLFAVLPPFLGASAVCECLYATTIGLGTVLQAHRWSDILLQHLTSVDGARFASDVSNHLTWTRIFVAPDECGSRRCICKYSYVADRHEEKKKSTEYLDH